MGNIFKILTPAEWTTFQRDGHFKGTSLDLEDGYIHSAYKDQYEHILQRFFNNVRPLVLTEVNPKLLSSATVKVEFDETSGIEYPHIYGAIPLTAVISHKIL